MNKSIYGNKVYTLIPEKTAAVAGDKVLYAFRAIGDMLIHCIIDFDGHIDEKRMAQAARLVLDAEPVLGCSFITGKKEAYWQRCKNLDTMNHCPMSESHQRQQDTLNFLIIPFADCAAPQVRLCLFRHHEGDRLIIKINHVVADAGGLKEYAYLLSDIYKQLAYNPSYRPVPNIKANRAHKQILYRFSFYTKLKIAITGLLVQKNWPKPKRYWSLSLAGTTPHYIFYTLKPAVFSRIKAYGKQRNATLNEMVLAVLMRSIHEVAQPDAGTPMKLQCTADLRRYLPQGKGEAITNLSGFMYLNFGTTLGDHFDDTLTIVKKEMRKNKDNFIGLGDIGMLECIGNTLPLSSFVSFLKRTMAKRNQSGFAMNCMTNMGPIDTDLLYFGQTKVQHAHTTAPLTYAPNMLIGVSGFADQITISCGYFKPKEQDKLPLLFDRLAKNFDLVAEALD